MKMKTILSGILILAVLSGLAACSGSDKGDTGGERITVRLVAPQNPYIQDFDTNLYKLWLEEQTGLTIEITWLPLEDAEKIVKQQLAVGNDLPDAYIGFGESTYSIFTNPNIQVYGERGVIIPLNSLIDQYGTHTKELWAELPEYNIQSYMTSADGNIYFMPGFSSSTITRHRQIMWVNKGWLDALGLEAPQTTDEFRDMLRAFKSNYPNAIPMAGTQEYYSKQPYDFLINAFVYNDINNSRLLLENGIVGFAPVRDEWRDALVYIRGLYDEGLYSPLSFTQDNQQMNQMANDPNDILGAFLSPGITLTVYQNSPEMLERYIGIEPLEGPNGVKLSTVFMSVPKPNGVITSSCRHPEEVFKLFDLMLSEEACLMGRYGTKGVDWDFAEAGTVSVYNTPATINIINQIWNTPQNKHICQIGPYVSRPYYSGGVTWDGNTTDGEYMNAQTAMRHREFEPHEYIGTLIFTPDEGTRIEKIRSDIEAHVKETAVGFITGTRDINDDSEWLNYLREFNSLGLEEFLQTAQAAWNRQANT